MGDEEEVIEEEGEPAARDEGEIVEASPTEKPLDPPKYEVRPGLGEKFQAENVREIILSTMQEQLMGRQYRADQAPRWCKIIANGVRQRAQELGMKRYNLEPMKWWPFSVVSHLSERLCEMYKLIAKSTILEMKGAGVKCGQRCIWDPETDDYIDDIYKNDTIFCHTVVYGVYIY